MGTTEIELARRICGDWRRGDFGSTWWIDPEIEWEVADALGDRGRGAGALAEAWRSTLDIAEGFSFEPEKLYETGRGVLVTGRFGGTARASGIPYGFAESACLFDFHNGRATRLVMWRNAADAFAALGVERGEGTVPA